MISRRRLFSFIAGLARFPAVEGVRDTLCDPGAPRIPSLNVGGCQMAIGIDAAARGETITFAITPYDAESMQGFFTANTSKIADVLRSHVLYAEDVSPIDLESRPIGATCPHARSAPSEIIGASCQMKNQT
jgi:hypothetical protein